MRYMLLMLGPQAADPEPAHAEDDEPCWMPWAREMEERSIVLKDGAQLEPIYTVTRVGADGAEPLIVDGPFAETKEQILGYDVIECKDLDDAIYAASRHPVAVNGGSVEVRPIMLSVG